MDRGEITVELVERLVASQFPQWAGLPATRVALDGWDNRTFRLGDTLSVRLPSADVYSAQVDKEQRWLPVLATAGLPVPIPTPLARGEPGPLFPRPWSVYGWIEGGLLCDEPVPDPLAFARDLAGFLTALYACEPDGPAPGDHSFARGGPVSIWNEQTRQSLADLDGSVDTRGALAVWEAALAARHEAPPVWAHGDVTGANLLVRDGRLAGVLDFGCSAVGDPACDLTIAWTFFTGESRERFKASVPVEASAWARGRGWALWKALMHLARDQVRPGQGARFDRKVGWRLSAGEIVSALIEDLAA